MQTVSQCHCSESWVFYKIPTASTRVEFGQKRWSLHNISLVMHRNSVSKQKLLDNQGSGSIHLSMPVGMAPLVSLLPALSPSLLYGRMSCSEVIKMHPLLNAWTTGEITVNPASQRWVVLLTDWKISIKPVSYEYFSSSLGSSLLSYPSHLWHRFNADLCTRMLSTHKCHTDFIVRVFIIS